MGYIAENITGFLAEGVVIDSPAVPFQSHRYTFPLGTLGIPTDQGLLRGDLIPYNIDVITACRPETLTSHVPDGWLPRCLDLSSPKWFKLHHSKRVIQLQRQSFLKPIFCHPWSARQIDILQ